MYRAMHADLVEKKRPDEARNALREAVRLNPADAEGRTELVRAAIAANDREAAAAYLDRTVAGDDPALLLALLESELRAGRFDEGREILTQLRQIDAGLRGQIVELAWTLGPVSPDAAYVCVDTAVEAELAGGNFMDAAAILQEFVTRVPGQIDALLKLVEIAVDGGLEAIMYEAQAHLADAYLERGQGLEARVIAEDLVAREPWEGAHIDRFRRALVLLQVEDPDAVIADRLSGQGPFIATDPFMAQESFTDDILLPPPISAPTPGAHPVRPAAKDDTAERAAPEAAEADVPPVPRAAEPDIPLKPRAPEPDIPLKPRAPEPEKPPAAPGKKGRADVDLTDILAELGSGGAAPAAPEPPSAQNLEAVFKNLRSAAAKQANSGDAAEYLGLGKAYIEMDMPKEAISALRAAARAPTLRFEAASILGRLYLSEGDVPHAIEWLERAAEAPAPGPAEACELLYDLGCILEEAGETSRALAVFLELQADAADYRDVAARVERLARVQAGS
jgi:tetratricopeptide (TPR) repeat protein